MGCKDLKFSYFSLARLRRSQMYWITRNRMKMIKGCCGQILALLSRYIRNTANIQTTYRLFIVSWVILHNDKLPKIFWHPGMKKTKGTLPEPLTEQRGRNGERGGGIVRKVWHHQWATCPYCWSLHPQVCMHRLYMRPLGKLETLQDLQKVNRFKEALLLVAIPTSAKKSLCLAGHARFVTFVISSMHDQCQSPVQFFIPLYHFQQAESCCKALLARLFIRQCEEASKMQSVISIWIASMDFWLSNKTGYTTLKLNVYSLLLTFTALNASIRARKTLLRGKMAESTHQ